MGEGKGDEGVRAPSAHSCALRKAANTTTTTTTTTKHDHHHHHHHSGGSRRGHFVPGVFFILWSWLWVFNILAVYFASAKLPARTNRTASAVLGRLRRRIASTPKRFYGQAWFEDAFLHPSLRLLEPGCKLILPAIAIFIELYAHPPHEMCFR